LNFPRLLGFLSLALLSTLTAHAAISSTCPKGSNSPLTCSTEKINGDCVLNIDRMYPIAMPTFQMHPGCHITVNVYHPFHFETLTLDPGTAQALQASDQGAALVAAAIGNTKGFSLTTSVAGTTALSHSQFAMLSIRREESESTEQETENRVAVKKNLATLNTMVTDALTPVYQYISHAKIIYAQVREIESSVPRPVDANGKAKQALSVPKWTYSPWSDYANWRRLLLFELSGRVSYRADDKPDIFSPPTEEVGQPKVFKNVFSEASDLLARVPTPDPKDSTKTILPTNPLFDSSSFDNLAKTTQDAIHALPQGEQNQYQEILDQLKLAETDIITALASLPGAITAIEKDFQVYTNNITLWNGDDPSQTGIEASNGGEQVSLGRIPDPISSDKTLATYNALGRQIAYTVNAVNQVATSTLAVPTATQKQAVVTITALYADPRFEVSAGAFVSSLPNRSFSNYTNVNIVSGIPTPFNIKIIESTSRPELLPFAAGNWRFGREYLMPGQRRGAFYGTAAVALNPYNSLPEFGGGVSFSWRSFMFSPLYHLGHSVQLTQGETVGEVWCVYGNASTATPPGCSPPPPAPSTKTYWTGAFAFGIGIRVPTSFSSSGSSNSSSGGSSH
jgi:hypothetical protein